jgi:GT2 family glycosyltransferase
MRPNVRVAVVVITWNDGALLDRAVSSVLASQGVDVELVVVDNGSSPAAVVPADPRVRLLRNARNRGVAPARNQGVRATTAPLVCLLDSDAELAPRSLATLAAAIDGEPDIGLAAPVFVGQRPEMSAGRAPTLRTKAGRALGRREDYDPMPGPRDEPWVVDFAIGACQLLRRDAFDAVGGLDETYFYGPEDVDFCLRLGAAGWRCVQVPAAEVVHPPRRRNRRMLTRRGVRHARAVARHLWRHRSTTSP